MNANDFQYDLDCAEDELARTEMDIANSILELYNAQRLKEELIERIDDIKATIDYYKNQASA